MRAIEAATTTVLLATALEAYRILGVFPHTGKSHHIMIEPLLRGLAERGHEVTVVGHYPLRDPPPNYVDVSLAGSLRLNVHACDFDDFQYLAVPGAGSALRHVMSVYELFDLAAKTCDAMSSHGAVADLLASNRTFDLVLAEQFNSDCALGVVHKLKIRNVVGVATHAPMPWTMRRFGLPEHPSFAPNHFLGHCRRPSAYEAVQSFFLGAYYNLAYYLATRYLEFPYMSERFGMSRADLDASSQLFGLLLVTTYFPLHGSAPRPPNVVEIGGVHLPEARPLGEKLQAFLDESPGGVVYVSMGSMIRGDSLPAEKLAAFQRAFAALPFRVLWKWESETMPGKPANVMIESWTPQFDVLGHPNVAAFVCHGGLLGLTEALHHGVPALVIPFFGDQFLNGMAAQESGLGEVLHYADADEHSLKAALERLTSPQFSAKLKTLTAIWNDRPQKPLDSAIFWIEHVAKFGSAHLRPAVADLSNFRYYMGDVLLALALFVCVLYKTLRLLLRTLYRRNKLKSE